MKSFRFVDDLDHVREPMTDAHCSEHGERPRSGESAKKMQIASNHESNRIMHDAEHFEELDYMRERNNATRFAASMSKDLPQVGQQTNRQLGSRTAK